MLKQYWDWISGIVFHADFGEAFHEGTRILAREIIVERLPVTIALMSFTILLTWTLAIPIGVYSAVRQHSIGDYTFTLLGFTGLAVPDFLAGPSASLHLFCILQPERRRPLLGRLRGMFHGHLAGS